MTPETERFLDKAQRLLRDAEAMLSINLNDAAGRGAYLAGFHAAQALISEKTGRSVKTHKGVHSEFLRLTRDNAELAPLTASVPVPILHSESHCRLRHWTGRRSLG